MRHISLIVEGAKKFAMHPSYISLFEASAAGNIINKKKASLHPTNVDCLLFLNKNVCE